ncbi:CheB methylesterase [Caldithrix abyssi DSM 13497]|uniref:protein-glutamate methylesterase n=1 Tax=Caldithrix abyssi DSM 13497 TaxID=880073 RepID=H1XW37_CALAY|nr:CheB methylesterase domain-containing protein [Caldithrix abyssi]APF17730.1 CheB methylesterase [Caldithrix abyssi DSM 13497]EHO41809.1 CheB methylesterase [Caldithrix abyssi DSM 13497]
MNILIIAQSMVYGTVIEQSLKKEKDFNVSLSFNKDQLVLNQLSAKHTFDFVVFVVSKEVEDFADRLHFLHQLFGCSILLLNAENLKAPRDSWLVPFPNFPLNPTDENFLTKTRELIQYIKNNQVKDTSHLNNFDKTPAGDGTLSKPTSIHKNQFELIAIGASTGGPQILNYLFKNLPGDLPVPIVVVQHMPVNFIPLFIEWLDAESPLHIQIARDGEKTQPGHVYFAPGDHHMTISRNGRIKLIDAPPVHSVKPAVSYLFKSVAEALGPRAIGILLTGMGKDGAEELALMKQKGALTIAQNKESCVVFGMPGVAIKLDAAQFIFSPEQIVEQIKTIFNKS